MAKGVAHQLRQWNQQAVFDKPEGHLWSLQSRLFQPFLPLFRL